MQQAHIEYFVHTPNLSCQLKLVCNVSNSTQDLKWSNKMLLQFQGAKESQIVGGQQNFIPNLELH